MIKREINVFISVYFPFCFKKYWFYRYNLYVLFYLLVALLIEKSQIFSLKMLYMSVKLYYNGGKKCYKVLNMCKKVGEINVLW